MNTAEKQKDIKNSDQSGHWRDRLKPSRCCGVRIGRSKIHKLKLNFWRCCWRDKNLSWKVDCVGKYLQLKTVCSKISDEHNLKIGRLLWLSFIYLFIFISNSQIRSHLQLVRFVQLWHSSLLGLQMIARHSKLQNYYFSLLYLS